MKIKDVPLDERPREKAKKYGMEVLTNAELLAIILKTGNKKESAIELSQKLINKIGGFQYLKDVNYATLTSIKGIKEAKAITFLSILEVAKRMLDLQTSHTMIKEPKDCYYLMKNKMMFEKQERVVLLCFNNHLEVIKEKTMFIGSDNMSIISGKEIIKECLLCGSSRMMLVHNHPSGHAAPSNEDIMVTKQIQEMAKQMDIEFLDHIIIGKNCFYSFSLHSLQQM